MAATTDDPGIVLSPPKLIGSPTVALMLGIARERVWRLVAAGDVRIQAGYLGKIGDRHVWNAHELFAGMYSSPMALWEEVARIENGTPVVMWCSVGDCEEPAHFLRLCSRHLNRHMAVWRRAERSTLAQWRLLAMCRWIVERNEHLTPPHGWDPWSGVCMTPGCENSTDQVDGRARASPLCLSCSGKFWNHEAGSTRGFGD